MNKAALRQKHKDLRLNADPIFLQAASLRIQEKSWEILNKYKSIGIYLAMDHEVQTQALIEQLLLADKIVCVPKIVKGKMIFIQFKAYTECERNSFGVLEPISNRAYLDEIDAQVIPMLAYNQRAYRLGYGKGYYDHYLALFKGHKLGVCFSMNRDENLMETEFDVKCDEILTEV